MAVTIVQKVIDALNGAGLPAVAAYPGEPMASLTGIRYAVSLEKLEYASRKATVAVTVAAPTALGGTACEDGAIQAGSVLEVLGGAWVQEACKFNSYADAFTVRVLGTFTGADALEGWTTAAGFTVTVAGTVADHAVSFQAEQAVDESTGAPLSSAVWTFRLVEQFGQGESPQPSPTGTFTLSVARVGGTEIYTDCAWTAVELEDTATGLRQVRQGVSPNQSFVTVI